MIARYHGKKIEWLCNRRSGVQVRQFHFFRQNELFTTAGWLSDWYQNQIYLRSFMLQKTRRSL